MRICLAHSINITLTMYKATWIQKEKSCESFRVNYKCMIYYLACYLRVERLVGHAVWFACLYNWDCSLSSFRQHQESHQIPTGPAKHGGYQSVSGDKRSDSLPSWPRRPRVPFRCSRLYHGGISESVYSCMIKMFHFLKNDLVFRSLCYST